MNWVWFGERRGVAFTCLFTTATRARLSLGYLDLGLSSLATAAALDFSPASFFSEF
jgi:hypothetical protein